MTDISEKELEQLLRIKEIAQTIADGKEPWDRYDLIEALRPVEPEKPRVYQVRGSFLGDSKADDSFRTVLDITNPVPVNEGAIQAGLGSFAAHATGLEGADKWIPELVNAVLEAIKQEAQDE